MEYIIVTIIFMLFLITQDCNIDISINPDLFILLRLNKKNRKKLYEKLKEIYEEK